MSRRVGRAAKLAVIAATLAGAGALGLALVVAGPGEGPALRTSAASGGDAPYTVAMSPMGEVRFARVPRRVVTLDAHYNDMLVALDHEAGLLATGLRESFFDPFYAQVPGLDVAFDRERMVFLFEGAGGSVFDKELLYALRADVHHVDPLRLAAMPGWSRADVEEIARNVGPFFANRYSRENSYPGSEPYAYYSVWALARKIGEVYRRPERVDALQAVHDEMVARIAARLPPEADRPRVGLVNYGERRFLPFSLSREGFGTAHLRAVGARDAFAGIRDVTFADAGRGTWLDLEGLLAIDPDVLMVPFAIHPSQRRRYEALVALGEDPIARQLRAFREGRVFPGGTALQGPITHLFQIEMAAKQLYPHLFGPYRDDHRYPPGEQLFDRARVAAALGGSP